MIRQPVFLPMSLEEGHALGIDQFDIILITGDAYVDHPSFGTAVIGRVLWEAGYTVGVIAQPDWQGKADFMRLGTPRLYFGISSGNVDSMVNHYTAAKKRRNRDAYSPGGIRKRPDRATIVYTDRVHALFPKTPIVLGGIEASLRRFAHYDYWSDRVRQSVLADAPADLLVFGMGERQVVEIARRISNGEEAGTIRDIPGTVYAMAPGNWLAGSGEEFVELPDYQEVAKDPRRYAEAFALHYREQDPVRGRGVAQRHPKHVVVQNRPAKPLSSNEIDRVYELPYSRQAHPCYRDTVPALEPVLYSLTSHRGCFGGCSFCALTHHQGRIIQSRSVASLVRELGRMVGMKGFRGIVTDVGGPTANMYGYSCSRWETSGACPDRNCSPECPNLEPANRVHLEMLTALRAVGKVKSVFVSSGIRYDLVPLNDREYLANLCAHHISGHLKVAPEHISPGILSLMRKPGLEQFESFREKFETCQSGKKKRQYLLPYFMSGHPGCGIGDMVTLAEYIRDHRMYTEQVQDFTPTPMSPSTCMYHTGLDPFSMRPVHIPKGREKQIQRAILQYRDKSNRGLVIEGLRAAGRTDLIGSSSRCLVSRNPV
ncbi:MAG: YgiQ family radical SAM protein [Methanoregulaceae archaeon]|nr:YgiQ family radical SAM protein [Methanoregulaceae archaeon]